MAAARIVLEPVFEADFLASSFGFRPKRSAHMAIEAIRRAANRWPSATAMNSIRSKIRALTARRYTEMPIASVVDRLNPVLRGWGNYFRAASSARKFSQIDAYVHERLPTL